MVNYVEYNIGTYGKLKAKYLDLSVVHIHKLNVACVNLRTSTSKNDGNVRK